ncbi:GAF domain-containing sensor histidine kinase [Mucilaginibacter gynuensis]|uniref:histidine kinase n=1 Tax=Mucilaginibacter gynuensis TaxID=1302236 RepID=A0ABP8G2W8_9SPHI
MPLFPVIANEDERLAALNSYGVLDTAAEIDFDEITTLASAICHTPVALISLVDAERQWFKSHPGVDVSETPKDQSFCAHAIAKPADIMEISDARSDVRFANNPLVTGDTNIVFYAGVPLVNEDGFALGTLCIIDHQQKKLTAEQANALRILAKQVMDKLELRRKMAALEATNQELVDSNVFIKKFASMAAHDIKNPLSSILLTSQALKIRLHKLQDEGCGKLVDLNITSTNRLITMLDEMLTYSQTPATLLAKKQRASLEDLLQRVLCMVVIPHSFEVKLPEGDHMLNISSVAFEQIFLNLISNAIRYNDKEQGVLQIRFDQDDDYYRFEVQDNGMGITEQYHEKIFANNFTLKITDRYNKKGNGIGLSTVKDLVKALKGSIHVKSAVGEGATFYITIKK